MKRKSLLIVLLMVMFAPLAMNAQTVLLSENFDSMSSISTSYSSSDWFAYNAGNGNNWTLSTSYPNSGTKCARYTYNSSNAANCYLVSAPFTTARSMTELSVSLYVRTGSYNETFEVFFVKARDAENIASATNYSAIASITGQFTGGYTEKTGSTTASDLANQSVRLVVHCTSAADMFYLNVDDITVSELTTDPYISLPATATAMIGYTATLTATYGNVDSTPRISYSSSNERVATVRGDGTTATVTGVSAGTATITATMTYEGRDYTADCAVTVEEPHYCTPAYSYTGTNYGMYIQGFSTEDGEVNISNTGTSLSTGGYGDYYDSYSATVGAGQSFNFTVTPGATVNPMKYGMWIDWNKDYDFDDDGENVAIQSSAIQSDWTGTVNIPSSTRPGSYRIRIEGMYSGDVDLDPCISGSYGEAEDYQLIVLEAPDCPKPSNVQLSALGNEVTVTWYGEATSYNISINGTVLPDPVTSPYVFTGEISTEYTIMLQSICSATETSDWSNAKSITTDACLFEDQCPITITLTDAYGDGGGSIYVVDANAETILAECILSGAASQDFTVYVCDGAAVDFYFYATDTYGYENGYVITSSTGEVIAEHEGCSDGSCDAPEDGVIASYTMSCSCTIPSNLAATEVDKNSAQLSWEGDQENYNVSYAKASFFEDFEGGSLPTGWTTIDNNEDGYDWESASGQAHSGSYVMTSYSSIGNNNDGWNDITPDNWLITPQLDLQGLMSVWARSQQSEASFNEEHFAIYLSLSGTDVSDFTITLVPETTTDIKMVEYTADLSQYAGQQGYIAIRHFNCYGQFRMNIDDFGIYEWHDTIVAGNNLALEGLDPMTYYIWKVQGIDCDGNGNNTTWSEIANFTTTSGIMFVNDGNWNEGNNWNTGEVPEDGEDVVIAANAIIPANYMAITNTITINDGGSLTIKDGGQLIHTNAGVIATVEKDIEPYQSEKDNYYLISTPVYDQDIYNNYGEDYQLAFPDEVTNMLENDYDLYDFDYSADLEWLNYENNSFQLWKNYGYLYANSGDGSNNPVTLQFTGALTPALTELDLLTGSYLPFTEDEYDFANWNMFGNPYPCNTYIWVYDLDNDEATYDHYTISGDRFIESDDPFTPAEGGFFISEGASQYALVAIAEYALGKKNFGGSLNLNITQEGKLLDAARIRFGESNGLKKFQLNPNHTKLFFTQDNTDFAVIRSEATGEMPVNFKAEKNGSYTLSFNNEEVSFSYLHLIDNLTGNDVDLLANPSYSFEAKTTDYTSRFKLVYSTGTTANNDEFAFISNNHLMILGVDGQATLKVMDVTGRTLSTETFSGNYDKALNMSNGVYMLQLIQGGNVKTQKIVVK
jgi:hypothetical protein